MNVGDKVKWKVNQTQEHWSGWGVVIDKSDSLALVMEDGAKPLAQGAMPGTDADHVLVEVHSFPEWLGALDGKFHPVIRCAVTWLTPLATGEHHD